MKLTLNTSDTNDLFFEDRRMLGIVCSLKNYVFCWHILNMLDLPFVTSAELQITLEKNKRSYIFTIYQCKRDLENIEHLLYSNKNDGEFLIPELQHFDYLWLIKNPFYSPDHILMIKKELSRINGVQLITELQLDKIKAKENLQY